MEATVTAQAQVKTELQAGVAQTFEVLAWEIELAGARCIHLDKLIGEILPDMPNPHREQLLESLHTVDLLAQHLTNLSAFARHMGESAPADMSVTVQGAIGDITLGALADRMFTALGGEEPEENDHEAGDLDLF